MRVYSNQPMREFLQGLRDNWIKHHVGQPYIDKLDELAELGSYEEQQYALEAARTEAENDAETRCQSTIDELRDEIDELKRQLATSRVDHPVAGQGS